MVTTEALEVRLADSGHRITEPRRALIDAMRELGDHFSAEELLQATPGVGRATVFRTLRLLLDLGALCSVVMPSGAVGYRLTSEGHHHHIVCSGCGAMRDFATCDIEDLLDELHRRTGYEIQAHRLEVYGLCAECRVPLQSPTS
ncbi:MAG: Fur family transcriptional regulator [Chloroflexota bacterium]|nr:Fur family transcriptional regulator [Chloroflexota bacterium]